MERPNDEGQNHSGYFAALNELLESEGPGRPVMIIDLDRMNHNLDAIMASIRPPKQYRIVAKSLPSFALIDHIMRRTSTRALMAFHQPFLNLLMERYTDVDLLLGKPMPIAAARTFFRRYRGDHDLPERNIQWLVDTPERLRQYHQLARELGTRMRINIEIDVGLRRGGLADTRMLGPMLREIEEDPGHLKFAGFMGYEPHLSNLEEGLDHPSVQYTIATYRSFIDHTRTHHPDLMGPDVILNGGGSNTFRIYEKDDTMNDLSAGSCVVKPTDFDTLYLESHEPAFFIATPVLKKYDGFRFPGDDAANPERNPENPNRALTYFVYGGYWKAKYVSPGGIPEPLYHSTNQEIINTSRSVTLDVDDYVFLRPTQSEFVMLQFGDLMVVQDGKVVDMWPVFSQHSPNGNS